MYSFLYKTKWIDFSSALDNGHIHVSCVQHAHTNMDLIWLYTAVCRALKCEVQLLARHMVNKHGQGITNSCYLCKKSHRGMSSAHIGLKRFKFSLPKCSMAFAHMSILNQMPFTPSKFRSNAQSLPFSENKMGSDVCRIQPYKPYKAQVNSKLYTILKFHVRDRKNHNSQNLFFFNNFPSMFLMKWVALFQMRELLYKFSFAYIN